MPEANAFARGECRSTDALVEERLDGGLDARPVALRCQKRGLVPETEYVVALDTTHVHST